MLTESKKFRQTSKHVLHIRPLAVENQLGEPFTDNTVEGLTAHLSSVVFCQRGEFRASKASAHGKKEEMTAVEPMGVSKELWELWEERVGDEEEICGFEIDELMLELDWI